MKNNRTELKINGKVKGSSEDKRFYLPGIKVESICPNCGNNIVSDYEKEHYLSYPYYNDWTCEVIYCSECDYERGVRMKINISVEIEDLD